MDATVETARKGIDVDILLASFPGSLNAMPKNFPNILYLDLLLGDGTPGNIRLRWKKIYHSSEMAQEFHMKTVTGGNQNYDVHISGSANKGFMTMRGAFRETQVMIFQPAEEGDTVAKLAKGVFDDNFEEKQGDSIVDISDEYKKVIENNIGAVAADMNYKFPKMMQFFFKVLNIDPETEAYKFFKKAREIGEGFYNPHSFSLPPTKRNAED